MVVSSHMMLRGLFGCPGGHFRKKMIARGLGNGQSESQAGDRDAFALLLRSIGPALVAMRGFASHAGSDIAGLSGRCSAAGSAGVRS